MIKALLLNFICITVAFGQKAPNTLLWEVTKSGSQYKSYLFGTFHEVSPDFFNSLSNAVKKLDESEVLFVEERLKDATKREMTLESDWNVEKWHKVLTDEQRLVFNRFVNEIADSTCYLQGPFELLIGISRNYMQVLCESDVSNGELMDTHIEKLAVNNGKNVKSLDIVEHSTLISEMDRISQETVNVNNCIKGMQSTLEEDLSGCKFLDSYRNMDVDYSLDMNLEENALNKSLLVDRNDSWILTLDQAFSSGNCFVAVGIRHLFYKNGLIQQLRSLGYTVSPIPSKL